MVDQAIPDRQETMEADFTEEVVPAHARRSNFRMFATFLSMQAVFGAVLVGYGARFTGLSLQQLMVAMAIAAATMTIYCVGSANVGSVVGMTHAVTTRGVFGSLGSAIVSLLLVVDGMGFYLFTVLFIMSLAEALFGTVPAAAIVTAVLALVMIVNNYFGFTGLQRFAQYVAVPVIILWGIYATIRAFSSISGDVLAAVPPTSSPTGILFVAGGMVGLSTWGNEPDVFRYAKSGRASWWNVPTLAIGYFVGSFLFPILGYLIASLSGQSDFAASIKYFADFTMFGLASLMMVVLLINQWAVQDGNLYICINGAQNLLSRIPGWRRELTVVGLGLIAAGLTFILPNLQTTFNLVTSIGAITVPTASTVMAMDLFVLPRILGVRRPMHRVATWDELALANWPGIIAVLAGTLVGAYTAGLIPFLSSDYIGFPPLFAWVTSAVVYLVLAVIAARTSPDSVLAFARITAAEPTLEPVSVEAQG